jgi:hypothetical protein
MLGRCYLTGHISRSFLLQIWWIEIVFKSIDSCIISIHLRFYTDAKKIWYPVYYIQLTSYPFPNLSGDAQLYTVNVRAQSDTFGNWLIFLFKSRMF